MSNRAADIQRILSDQDPEFRQWADEHRRCESRLSELTSRTDITVDDELEEKSLKKRKLHLKDQMAERVRNYEHSPRRSVRQTAETVPSRHSRSASGGSQRNPLCITSGAEGTNRCRCEMHLRDVRREAGAPEPPPRHLRHPDVRSRSSISSSASAPSSTPRAASKRSTAGRTTARRRSSSSTACLSLLIAAVFDTFDGMIARQLGATSEFGKEYDSLADVVTFGAAPAVLVYAWGLHVFDNLGGGIAFLFLAAVSLRLARFNVHDRQDRLPLLRRPAQPRRRADAGVDDLLRAGAGDGPPLRRDRHDPDGLHRLRDGLADPLPQPEGPRAAERALADVLPGRWRSSWRSASTGRGSSGSSARSATSCPARWCKLWSIAFPPRGDRRSGRAECA